MNSCFLAAGTQAELHASIMTAAPALAWIDESGVPAYKRSRVSDPFAEMADEDPIIAPETDPQTARTPTGRWLINIVVPEPSPELEALTMTPSPSTPDLVAA